MNDLRAEIRAEFEREQSGYPPPSDLRPRLVRAARVGVSARQDLQWVAAVAVVLIAALIVLSLVLARGAAQKPTPAATPGATRDYGAPPARVPLFYVGDSDHPGWYTGFDWNGVPRGTIKLELDPIRHLIQAPDGSGFILPAYKGLNGLYYDRLGKPLDDPLPSSVYHDLMWSDDSERLCTLSFDGKWHIGVMSPGGVPTTHVVAIDDFVVRSGVIAIAFSACSPRNDRAVLVYSFAEYPTIAWVVRISDGKVLMRRAAARNQLANVVASPDGSLVAESSNASAGYIGGPSALQTLAIRTPDGNIMRSFDRSIGVLAFSDDDRYVLVNTGPYAPGVATHLATIDLATGAVVWQYDGADQLSGVFVEPGGSAFALMMQSPADSSLHPRIYVTIADVSGKLHGPAGKFVHP